MISSTNSIDQWRQFIKIESAVCQQLERFSDESDCVKHPTHKEQEIRDALERLRAAVLYKNSSANSEVTWKKSSLKCPNIKLSQVAKMDFSTIDFMLDAQISESKSEITPGNKQGAGYYSQISIRQALNISRNNFFNSPGATWGPLWGKSLALEQVEKELRS